MTKNSISTQQIHKINHEINVLSQLLNKISLIQKFPEHYEQEFQHDFYQQHYYLLRLILIIGFFLYGAYGLADIYTIPNWHDLLLLRYVYTMPVLFVIVILSFTRLYHKWHQPIATLFALVMLTGLSSLGALVPMYYKVIYYQSMSLVAYILTLIAALQFSYSIVVCVFTMLAFNLSYALSKIPDESYYFFGLVSNNYVLLTAMGICCIVSYLNELKARKEFLLKRIIRQKNKLLDYMTKIDEVTGVSNRRYLDERLGLLWKQAIEMKHPLAILFADFDSFKAYNDHYGHLAGDSALRQIAACISNAVDNANDFVGRYGGDEFIIVLANKKQKAALQIATNIMHSIKNLNIEHDHSSAAPYITITMGLAVQTPHDKISLEDLIEEADTALQYGKKVTRNRIYYFDNQKVHVVNADKSHTLV